MSGFMKLLASMGMPIPRLADGFFVKISFLVAVFLFVIMNMRQLYHRYLPSDFILFKGYHTSHPQTPEQLGE